jgi:hypothetical protein
LASEQLPLLFFKPLGAPDPLTVAQSLLNEAPSPSVFPLNPLGVLQDIRSARGFARLKISLPHFEWPKWEVPSIDRGFAGRMQRILQRKTTELREVESDEKRRSQILDAFVKSPDFRAEMAREARREPGRGKRTYDDVLNVYAKWKNGRASATELGALRKLDTKLATRACQRFVRTSASRRACCSPLPSRPVSPRSYVGRAKGTDSR